MNSPGAMASETSSMATTASSPWKTRVTLWASTIAFAGLGGEVTSQLVEALGGVVHPAQVGFEVEQREVEQAFSPAPYLALVSSRMRAVCTLRWRTRMRRAGRLESSAMVIFRIRALSIGDCAGRVRCTSDRGR